MKGVAKMERQRVYKEVYDSLNFKDIAIIFKSFLQCPESGGCEKCVLNENKIQGHRIGCLKLRDIAMQKVIDINDAMTLDSFDKEGCTNGKDN
jgi:hypothetical protein